MSVREKKKGKEGDGRRGVRCELGDYKCQPFLSSCPVNQVLLAPRRRRLLQLRRPPATSLLRRERARGGCRLVWDVCTQCENFSKFDPCDQLSRNQLLLNQLPTGQLPLNQLPTKSTVNLCMNACTNEQVHYCSITKVQFGVALNTLQDYFHQHSESVQKACEFSHLGCISSFKVVWLHLHQTAPTSFLSFRS